MFRTIFELKRETVAYKAVYPPNSGGTPYVFTLKWPSASSFRKLFNTMIANVKQVSTDELHVKGEENPHIADFIQAHVQKLAIAGGETLSEDQEEIIEFLKGNPETGFAEALVSLFVNIDITPRKSGEVKKLSDIVSREPIEATFTEYNIDEATTAFSSMRFHLKEPTALDRQEYRDASVSVINTKKQERHRQHDPHALTNIFKRLCTNVEGDVTIEGQALTDDNHSEWVEEIPFPWIFGVLSEAFAQADASSFR